MAWSAGAGRPAGTVKFSVVTKNDAEVGSTSHSQAFAIGGTLSHAKNTDGSLQKYVGGGTSYVHMIASGSFPGFRFEGRPVLMQGLPFAFSELEQFALRLRDSNVDGKRVCVFARGGAFDASSCSPSGQGGAGNSALMVFTSSERVTIQASSDGRPFTASVLAPFAKVKVDPNVQFVSGFVIAESYETGAKAVGLQMRGMSYDGPLTCGTDAPSCATLLAGRTNAKATLNKYCNQLDGTDLVGGCSAFYAQWPNGNIDLCRQDFLTTSCIAGTDATNDAEGVNCAASTAAGAHTVQGGVGTGACTNVWKAQKCAKKRAKGKCRKRKAQLNCRFTCGVCTR